MLYRIHCESGHGRQGHDDGMVGAALRTPPRELSLLSQKHGGVFPDAEVRDVIDGERHVLTHGPQTMPVWGRIFQGKETIDKLVEHLRSLPRMESCADRAKTAIEEERLFASSTDFFS